ncbi:MAG: HPr family phosphocarrier protein [Planctomycetales bacterium]|jgi:phosphotransferase system HPr (HPr) family protein|nr:HPr family phosphocarrier protein [Planctomycetales bacterium]
MANSAHHSLQATVRNSKGLHMRPLEVIARKAQSFLSQINVTRGLNRVDAKSFLHLLTLGADAGTQLNVEATGEDAESAVQQLVTLIESDFEIAEVSARAN